MASSTSADTITATSPGGAAEMMMPITVTHLILIAVAIILTIAMIVWGQKRRRQRREGERDLAERGETVEVGAGAQVAETMAANARLDSLAAAPIEQRRSAPSTVPIEPSLPAAMPEREPVEPPAPPVAPAPPPIADTLPATPSLAAEPPLTTLKGLGPKAAAVLGERGIGSIADLAALSPDQAAALDADLGPFSGRMSRDRWHEQARLLASGNRAGYEAIFGKLG